MHSDTENKYKGVANGEMLPAIASSLACTLGYNSRSRYEGTFRQGSETRLRIICTAADLFHKQGVRATSPDDIIEASKTGKGQFYHYFKSKERLVHEVLQTHLRAIRAGSAPLDYDISSWQDLETWFLRQIELQKTYGMKRGCPF